MKASGTTTAKELGNPPGRVVWWVIQGTPSLHAKGKTAFEAAASLGFTLSQCGQITWQEEEPHGS